MRRHSAEEKGITVVWQVDRKRTWESSDWIKEVLAGVEFKEIDDGNWKIFNDRSIVIVPKNKKSCRKKYFEKLRKKGYKFGVIQLGDEFYHVKESFYKGAAFILRNYWHKNCGGSCLAFPLGYKRDFWEGCASRQTPEAACRKYVWSFAGQTNKSTRLPMVANMKKISGYHIHEISSFNDPKSLGASDYRALLLESVFVPCPRGWWNLDSFRVYEALECGCIPIVEKSPIDYFTGFLGVHPFPSVASWEEAPERLNYLLAHPEELEELRLECIRWWADYKEKLKNQVAFLVKEQLNIGGLEHE